ncbi:oligosaccharide repeat unit polymerase [Mammaliicoccus fleurettii]|uniref:O-antigen polymerase n=1 Tax=Mammaliicoccus TaxID=2803850 RepID=UPI001EFA5B28|nr:MULTISPECIES: O-antigen polymerase [Mammaliicoccus]MEB6202171.1 oligosaccharide repeat unit polymerase [Mammaliicoccus fleurettii]
MKYDNKNAIYLKILLVLFLIAISILLMVVGLGIWGGILALGVLVVISWIISNFEPMHPLTWFPPIFFLYSISYPLLVTLGELPNRYDKNIETLIITWLALFTFIVVMSISSEKKIEIDTSLLKNLMPVVNPIFWVSIILTAVYVAYVFSSGLTSKYAITLDRSPLGILASFFPIVVISFALIMANQLAIKGRVPKGFLLVSILYGIVVLFVLGERDFILKLLIITIFMYHVLKKNISKKKLITLGIIIISMIPILGILKNRAFGQSEMTGNEGNFITDILSGEFMAVGRNIANLLSTEGSGWSYFLGETLWWDIKVLFSVGFSPGAWFNNTFHPDLVARGGGNGFTLVGEGYMNFGIFGVIIFFAMLAVFLKFLYKKATKSVVWLSIYIVTIPLTLYVIRADFATLLAQFSKQIVIPIMIIFVIKYILDGIPSINNTKKLQRKYSR